ncbi:MAG: formate dehydrogenase subunit delta [Gemmatimonadetes bacterium]|nr:formate dehydrogenase subunit delta [Gemmatimonadota bacterium]MBK6778054.1 formate dehydrogenase subunit delta [Gemmatimonadota bacterium]MBK7925194.1 formate dehydrogenase subunit delta [Gemmatimonadota bacterium]MBK9692293.1 formate dehydrogenase subunit delta [Gemmatimonadota bacterium]
MNTEHLIQMANQIAQYHEAFPEHAEAIEGIYTHLRRFWEPRMRTAIYAYLDQHHGEGLHPLVLETLRTRATDLRPRPKPTPAST